jgi:cyclophilin family peptidyl-prolyl cis-trans isomerase
MFAVIERQVNEQGSLIESYKSRWKDEARYRAEDAKKGDLPQVKLDTSRGEIVIELFEDDAPNVVANFITLVESGFYDGTKFHRVISGFMAQGGDPLSKDADPANDGTGGPGYRIKTQESKRWHFRGVVSMANSGPNTEGSQFFITTAHTPHLNGKHSVFGRVIKGRDVADKLAVGDVLKKATVLRKRKHEYKVEKLPAGKKPGK